VNDVVVAPFSNSAIRDWPGTHFDGLIGLLLEEPGIDRIRVIGTASQRLGACEIVRRYSPARVVNECGRLPWGDVLQLLGRATCVIGNNSGVAHVSGAAGTPTVCVFGGSHDRREWRPRGSRVVVVSRTVGCSPCQLDHGGVSPYGKACLKHVAPEAVRDAVRLVMAMENGS
jgi:heptosyltransferase-2